MVNELEIFCRNIAWLKEKHGISNRRMAKILGIGEGSLRRILHGELPPRVNVSVLFCAAREFRYKPHEFFNPLYEQQMS